MILSYIGLVLGYFNKGYFFILLLSTDQIGLVNLLIAVGILLAQLSNLGTIYTIWKFFPFFRNAEKKHYGFLLMNILIALAGVLLATLLVVLFRNQIGVFYAEKSKLFVDYYYLIIPIGVATVYFLLFENYMRGLNKNIFPVFLNEFVSRVLLSILLLAFGMQWISFDTFLVLYAFSHFLPTFVLAAYLVRAGEISFSLRSISIPKRFKKIIISFSLFSYFNTIGILIVITMDAMMIASMQGLKATGVYTTIVFIISALQVPYKSLTRISSPLVSVYWKEKKIQEMNLLYKQVSSISLIIALFLFALVWINRVHLFSLLPAEYADGIPVFLFLMIGRILDMYFGLNGIIFITSKKYRYDLIFTAFLIISVFLLNLWLIPVYGMAGAAISTAVALVVYNIGRVMFIYFAYNMHPFEWNQLKVIALFFCLISLFQWGVPPVSNLFLGIGINSLAFSLAFLLPIFYWKWNTDLNNYIEKGWFFILKRFKRG